MLMVRNLVDPDEPLLRPHSFLNVDRNTKSGDLSRSAHARAD